MADDERKFLSTPALEANMRANLTVRAAIIEQLEGIDLSIDPDLERRVLELQRQLFTAREMRIVIAKYLDGPEDKESEEDDVV